MHLYGRFFVSIVCLFRSRIASQIDNLLFECYLSRVRFFFEPFMKCYSLEPVPIGSPTIGSILSVGSLAKIGKPIVSTFSIYVINLIFRPFASYVEPSQAVSEIRHPVQFYDHVALIVKATGNFTDANLWTRYCPIKKTSVWVVADDIAHRLVSYFSSFCHNDDHIRFCQAQQGLL